MADTIKWNLALRPLMLYHKLCKPTFVLGFFIHDYELEHSLHVGPELFRPAQSGLLWTCVGVDVVYQDFTTRLDWDSADRSSNQGLR